MIPSLARPSVFKRLHPGPAGIPSADDHGSHTFMLLTSVAQKRAIPPRDLIRDCLGARTHSHCRRAERAQAGGKVAPEAGSWSLRLLPSSRTAGSEDIRYARLLRVRGGPRVERGRRREHQATTRIPRPSVVFGLGTAVAAAQLRSACGAEGQLWASGSVSRRKLDPLVPILRCRDGEHAAAFRREAHRSQ